MRLKANHFANFPSVQLSLIADLAMFCMYVYVCVESVDNPEGEKKPSLAIRWTLNLLLCIFMCKRLK